MGRRGENIRKRRDGRWEARVVCAPPVNGRTRYKYLYSSTYQGVKNLKKEYVSGLRARPQEVRSAKKNTDAPQKHLFRTAAAQWLAEKRLSVKASSHAAYTQMVETHLLPAFGDLDVRELDAGRIGAFLREKKEHGSVRDKGPLSDKTVSEIKGTLNRILRCAQSHHLIDAVPDSMPVSVRQPAIAVLTSRERQSLEEKAVEENTPFSLGVLLCMNTGIREGELCGLRWEDFDWEEETVSIHRTVTRIANTDGDGPRTRVLLQTPKTACSVRTVPLPSAIISYLRERAGEDSDYVVTGSKKYMEPRVCRDRYARLERRAGVKHHKFHTLRHTYSTNCVEQGVNIKVLSENLGHSDVNITLQRYVHPSMEAKKAEVNKLPTFAGRPQGQPAGAHADFT